MKKIIIAILILTLLYGLSGCDKFIGNFNQTTELTQQAPNTTENSMPVTTNPPQQLPMLAVNLPISVQTETADDGTEIYTHTYQDINMIVTDPEIADKIIIEFLNRTDLQSTISSIHASALQAYTQDKSSFIPYWTQIQYDPVRIDSSILSLSGGYTQYSGGAHAMHTYKAVTYDLISGNVLNLNDIINADVNQTALCDLVLQALTTQKDALYMGYETTIKEHFAKPLGNIDNWCLTGTGLCFGFSPYEIGPYTSNTILAEIPYKNLSGILQDAYFPAERNAMPGNIDADIFDEKSSENFSQFAEIVLTKGGEKIVLYTNSIVYDICIETGEMSADGSTFNADHTVFAAYTLTPGDGIMIQSSFDNTLPNLRLSYTTAGETVQKFISVDNGIVTLK